MSLRALTREQSDFAVRFVNCGGVMVRQRVHIATEDRIRVNEIYQVKWNREEYASAVILGSGDYAAMSALVEKAKQDNRFSLAVESDDPSSPPVERAQPKKKRQTKKTSTQTIRSNTTNTKQTKGFPVQNCTTPTKSGKPAARVIRVVTPPGFYDPLPVIRPPRRRIATTQQPASAESSHQTQPAVPLPVPTSSTPVSIRGPNPTAPTPPLVSPFTPARPTHTSSHLGPVMSALAAIGSAVTSIQKNLDTLNKS
ncbi:unnamed protein product [Mytilus coruscus]|uniref:Uncharacterized protein n=1 Tax=Mytilus coruscus TaxID=42192 RepID=A0A6J8CB26_MYTCO|nr:unnamed protein product [Mytilus coruscus]